MLPNMTDAALSAEKMVSAADSLTCALSYLAGRAPTAHTRR